MRFFLLASMFLCASVAATAAEDGSQLTIEQWVSQDSQGNVAGRIVLPTSDAQMSPVGDVKVVISTAEGKMLQATENTNSSGEFEIADVPAGVYTLLARGKNVYACCALHVVDADNVEQRHQVAQIAAAKIDFTEVRAAIIRYLPPSTNQTASFEMQSAQKVMTSFNEEHAFRVAQTNGGLSGQLFQAGLKGGRLANAGISNILVYQDGEAIAQTVSHMDGTFEIDSLEPGQYSLMSIGPDGLGITSFELVASSQVARVMESGEERLISTVMGLGCCQKFEMQIAPCCGSAVVEEVLMEEVVAPCGCGTEPCSCGEVVLEEGIPLDAEIYDPLATPGYASGYGGGGYGGGGGGYGGGGYGGIAGLAGLGIAIAALADDNNNAILAPVPVSPIVP